MAKSTADRAIEAVQRDKDAMRRLDQQRRDLAVRASVHMAAAADAKVTRTILREIWKTSFSQIDRMISRGRAERR